MKTPTPHASFRRHLLRRIALAMGVTAALTAGTGCDDGVECFDSSAQMCPSRDESINFFELECGEFIESVDSDAVQGGGECCYEVTIDEFDDSCCGGFDPFGGSCAVEGRPMRVDGATITATAVRRDGWADEVRPNMQPLSEAQRAALCASWTRAALDEHASVASFSRFALELMALGAPSVLVAAAHSAALDEVRHARISFSLAAAFGAAPVGPSAMAIPRSLAIEHDMSAFAVATALDACINETLAVIVAAEARAQATDEAVLTVLDEVVDDEACHAELAWASLRWAIGVGGEPVRDAVRAAVAGFDPLAATDDRTVAVPSHGLLAKADRHAALVRGYCEVVAPAMAALLAAPSREADVTASEAPTEPATELTSYC